MRVYVAIVIALYSVSQPTSIHAQQIKEGSPIRAGRGEALVKQCKAVETIDTAAGTFLPSKGWDIGACLGTINAVADLATIAKDTSQTPGPTSVYRSR
jgi:hypothetical protein